MRTACFFDMRLFFILDPTTVLVKIIILGVLEMVKVLKLEW